jgi:DNA-binding response OmpR family regulator
MKQTQPIRDVLVVDDDPAINKLLCQYFQLEGFSVRSAVDGRSALREAQERPPMIVLLDLMLPDTTGFEVCLELKRDKRTRDIPIIMVTALTDDESRRRGMECGAVEYVIKPFNPEQLIETVRKRAA